MPQIQLNFTLRVASKSCKTVHLIGSWDNYQKHLPLSRDPSSSSKNSFIGTFRFAPPALLPGCRYWYYYMIDAHTVTYDPKHEYVIEPTTGRTLNILDIPGEPTGVPALHSPSGHNPSNVKDMRPSARHTHAVVNGRGLSPSRIQHPLPSRPYETQKFSSREMEALSRRYAAQRLVESSSDASSSDEDGYGYSSGSGMDSLSSRSSHNSSPDSLSSLSAGPGCTCERFAVTRSGQKVRVDCRGAVCGGSDKGSDCSSESEGEVRYSSSTKRSGGHRSSGKKHGSGGGKGKRHGRSSRH